MAYITYNKLDASDNTCIFSNTAAYVGAWKDFITNNVYVAVDPTQAPRYSSNIINGHPGIYGNRNAFLEGPAFNLAGSAAREVWIVAKSLSSNNSAGSEQYLFNSGSSSVKDSRAVLRTKVDEFGQNVGMANIWTGDGSNAVKNNGEYFPGEDTGHIIRCVFNAGSMNNNFIEIDGVKASNTYVIMNTDNLTGRLFSSGDNPADKFGNVAIGLFVVTGLMTGSEATSYRNMLVSQYGF